MAKKNKKTKRDRLINAAAELFHHHGPLTSSRADIAGKADIPSGNVYYYFKSKEELILAVIGKRKESMAQAYVHLEQAFPDPRERLVGLLSFFDSVKSEYSRYGCPLGRLINELNGESVEAKKATSHVVDEFVSWTANQFEALGHKAEARHYAITLMAGIEGAAVMAKNYGDEKLFASEVARLIRWVEEIPNNNAPVGKFKMA